jgi:hypothetical protein
MKKAISLAAFFCLLSVVGFAVSSDEIGERGPTAAQPQFRHEGNGRTFFNVVCSSYTTSWTAVVAAGVTSRSVLVTALASNSAGVCLSSATSTGACDDSKEAVHLYQGASLTDYGTGSIYCRSRAGYADRVAGYRAYHLSD